MIFGWGRNGYGWGAGNGGGGSEVLGYELGKVATTNDVASGFTTNTILGVQREQTLSMQNGFANVNSALTAGFHGVDNALCTLGYNMSQNFNNISREIADCCCNTTRMIERQTCDIINNQNSNTQRLMDYLYQKELEAVKSERDALRLKASQAYQTDMIVSRLAPTPVPSYNVPNPNCCYSNTCGTIL
jgi:hypothetical protein